MLQIEGKKGAETQFASPFSAPRHCLEKLGLPSRSHQPMNGKSWGEGHRSSRRRRQPTSLLRKVKKICTCILRRPSVRGELLIPPRHYQSRTYHCDICRTFSSLLGTLPFPRLHLSIFCNCVSILTTWSPRYPTGWRFIHSIVCLLLQRNHGQQRQ